VLGTIEPRDLRRQIPWYGSIYNKFNYMLAAYSAWLAISATAPVVRDEPLLIVLQIALAGSAFMLVNNTLSVLVASARTGTPVRRVFTVSLRNVGVGLVSQVPLGWLMAEIANEVGEWATLLFIVPLLLARFSFTKYTEIRDLFYGSVSALSQAIDAKDGFTRGHADRVSRIAGAIAREIGLPERQIEQIELAAMLHDIGKIGVEDRILMKPSRLDPDETVAMRRHSVYGASILEPSAALRPLVPMVLHHHESYDGSGYPEGLKGDEIPLGSRVIIVADAYEAMTSDRIYRKAMGHERAMEQLQKFKGVQFDPKMVRAIDQLLQKRGPGAFEVSDLPPIEYETLAELRSRLAHEPASRDAHAG
jgi:HD-GYP domain-containing protein (c-di-GMP phosphodiesterase class II)